MDGDDYQRETLAARTIRLYVDAEVCERELMAYLNFGGDVYEVVELKSVKTRLRYCWFQFTDGSRVRVTLRY